MDNSAFSLFSTRQLGLPEITTIYWEFRLNHVRLPKLHIWCISYTATLHSSLAPLILKTTDLSKLLGPVLPAWNNQCARTEEPAKWASLALARF